jgi:hypothetical protein
MMKVNVDVYTKDLDAALTAFRTAFEVGAVDVDLRTYEEWDTHEFEYFQFTCDADHTATALFELLDSGPFDKDSDKL